MIFTSHQMVAIDFGMASAMAFLIRPRVDGVSNFEEYGS
jgi:hypothetical protein